MRTTLLALLAVTYPVLAPPESAEARPSAALSVGSLRWDGRENPLGLIQFEPRLRWVVSARSDASRGERQTAWQVLVATHPERLAPGRADLWDSGKVASGESINIRYGGPSPQARQRLFWTVRVWDAQDRPSAFAPPAWAEMALFDEEWEGQWIGRPRGDWPGAAAPAAGGDRTVTELRRRFSVSGRVARARLYASAFGVYELRLNGQRVSEQVLAPGYTDYVKRVAFQTQDVTGLLRRGDNTLEARVAGGWCTIALAGRPGACGAEAPRIMVQLELTAPDGQRQSVLSDGSWQARAGAWRSAHLVEGEHYDARLEGAAPEAGWVGAEIYDRKKERDLVPDPGPPLEIAESIAPAASSQPRPGIVRLDFGKEVLGWVRLETRAASGTAIQLRYLSTGAAEPAPVDRYIARGGLERWEPRFSLKRFRFVEVDGLPAARARTVTVVARRVHSRVPVRGWLETSDRRLDRLFAAADDGLRATLASVPLSAGPGQRPGSLYEVRAWSAGACLTRDVQSFYRKWMDDLRDAQLPGGAYPETAPTTGDGRDAGRVGAVGVLIPAALDRCYADRTALDAHLPSMGRWLEQVRSANPELVWTRNLGRASDRASDDAGSESSTAEHTLLATAELAHVAESLAALVRPVGPAARSEAERLETLGAEVRAAFRRRFSGSDGRLQSSSTSGLALALSRELVPAEQQERVGQQLLQAIELEPGCPVKDPVAAAHLLPALSRIGRDDLALSLLLDGRCPSGSARSAGLPEALASWLFENVGGLSLDAAAPGGRQVFVRPRPGGRLAFARARHDSLYGPVSTHWRQDGDSFRLRLEVPPGARATVVLPFPGRVTESGTDVRQAPGVSVVGDGAELVLGVVSGRYDFQVRRSPAPMASGAAERR